MQLVLEGELRRKPCEVFERFDRIPLGSASIAQVDYEFDFFREAKSMDRIGEFLQTTNKGKPPVIVPRPIPGMTTRKILKDLTTAYGQMIHADPHPGNILINKDRKVALLDYGQVKDLPQHLRLGFARLVLALVSDDPLKIGQSFRELGIRTTKDAADDPDSFRKLAQMMFDTNL